MKLLKSLALAAVLCCGANSSPAQTPTAPAGQGAEQPMPDPKAEKIYKSSEVDKRAKIIHQETPVSPPLTGLGDLFSGVVRLRVILRADGKVTDIELLNAVPLEIRKASVEAIRKLKFKPATKDGRPASQYAVFEHRYNFTR